MRFSRTPLAMVGIASATAVIGTAVLGVGAVTLGKAHGTAILPRIWAKWVLRFCGVKVAVTGMERIDTKANYVFVSNHVSLMDAPAIVSVTPQKVRFVAKRSLFYVPLFGQALWAAGNIAVNRARTGGAMKRLSHVSEKVGKEISLLFFPEGTRSESGRLLPFKKGAAVMALQSGVSVVPIAVAGTHEILPKKSMDIRPGVIGVAFGTPIPVHGKSLKDREALTEQIRLAVEKLQPEAEEARRKWAGR